MRPWKAGSRYATCGARPRESRHVRRRQFGLFTATHSGHRKADGSSEKIAPVDRISISHKLMDTSCKPHHATRPPGSRRATIGFGHYPGDLPNGPFDTGEKGGHQNGRGEGGTAREHVGRSRSRERPMAGRNAPAGRGGRMAGHPPGNAPPLGKVRAAGAREDGAVSTIPNPLPPRRGRAAHGGDGRPADIGHPIANRAGSPCPHGPRFAAFPTRGRNWKLALPDSPEPSVGRYRGNHSVMLHALPREFCMGGRVHHHPQAIAFIRPNRGPNPRFLPRARGRKLAKRFPPGGGICTTPEAFPPAPWPVHANIWRVLKKSSGHLLADKQRCFWFRDKKEWPPCSIA